MKRDPNELARENNAVLSAVHAMLGLISRDIYAVSLELKSSEHLVMHFAVRQRSADVEEDISDIVVDMDALTIDGAFETLSAEIHVGPPPRSEWLRPGWRPVYWAKE